MQSQSIIAATERLKPVAQAYGTNARWLATRVSDYFGTLDFSGMQVLDIGAGAGRCACCVASLGADRVVALEPEESGSNTGVITKFQMNAQKLGLSNLQIHTHIMQDFAAPADSFDVIYMINSINHIAEDAVRSLHNNPASHAAYMTLLQPIMDWLKSGGLFVISDASRFHPYGPLIKSGFLKKHPFFPQINWELHQPPAVWMKLLTDMGFMSANFHWASNWRYDWMPRFLTDNALAAYFYSTQFVIRAVKKRA
jgi:SAM-dependent methyltransferase